MLKSKSRSGIGDAAALQGDHSDKLNASINSRKLAESQAKNESAGAPIHPLDILFDRSCALAARVAAGTLPFIDAVDMAYTAADFAGLVEIEGDDIVQRVLAAAFVGARP